ncbi:MAG: ribbon-helix-helix protein, CopG family [Candidatus Micrarchaeota archaeon]|nr:ribbon-helix-helix protein, CopG family [Candidatus Micrarchaeota archaeon]
MLIKLLTLGDALDILSISIDDETKRRLDGIQRRLGFRSRSKLLRNAIQGLMKDYEALEGLGGVVEAVFVVSYKESEKNHVSNTLHKFKEDVLSELHQHGRGSCIDVLNIRAPAKRVQSMFVTLKRNKCVYSVVYSIISAWGKSSG